MKLPCEEDKLINILEGLCRSVEDILLTGMTAAGKSTRDSLSMAFREASQMRLLRLGSTLRVAVEEINRFSSDDPLFSTKRLNFFLNRAWMLSHGLKMAVQKKDEAHWKTLTWNPGGKPADAVETVTVGVSKRVVKGAFCAFEFRLRSIGHESAVPHGTPLIWSAIFPLKKGSEVEGEAFLHLPQKQKFRPCDLYGKKASLFEKVMLIGEKPPYRLILNDQSTVKQTEEFSDWEDFAEWNPEKALSRLQDHTPGPFELDVELQEEVCLEDWELGKVEERDNEPVTYYSIFSNGLHFHAQIADDDETTKKKLTEEGKKYEKLPLYGLLHYESCRFVLQPLSVFSESGTKQLMISEDKKGAASILRTLKF
jgi:hypothetical protein